MYFVYLESNKTTSLSPPPTYTNRKLQQIIDQNKNESVVGLDDMNLTSEDTEIVVYYLLRNNTVINSLFIFILRKCILF